MKPQSKTRKDSALEKITLTKHLRVYLHVLELENLLVMMIFSWKNKKIVWRINQKKNNLQKDPDFFLKNVKVKNKGERMNYLCKNKCMKWEQLIQKRLTKDAKYID